MQSLACQAMPMHELESFILADDRNAAAANWIKSGVGKQYLKLMHTLNTKGPSGLTEEEEDLLKKWMQRNRHGEYLNPVLKYCLESISKEKDKTKKKELLTEFNNTFLHYSFNEERDLRGIVSKKTTIESETSVSSNSKKKEKIQVANSEFSVNPSVLKAMSTDELIKLIQEDKSWFNFELETADFTFLKKIDWEKVVNPSRIEIALDRLPDFCFNKVA